MFVSIEIEGKCIALSLSHDFFSIENALFPFCPQAIFEIES